MECGGEYVYDQMSMLLIERRRKGYMGREEGEGIILHLRGEPHGNQLAEAKAEEEHVLSVV